MLRTNKIIYIKFVRGEAPPINCKDNGIILFFYFYMVFLPSSLTESRCFDYQIVSIPKTRGEVIPKIHTKF